VWLGKSGWADWSLKAVILEGDWTFVTQNSIDFRGPALNPGSRGQYVDVAIHAGLICLNSHAGMDLDLQAELFTLALDQVSDGDLINQVLEVKLMDGDTVNVLRYALPRE